MKMTLSNRSPKTIKSWLVKNSNQIFPYRQNINKKIQQNKLSHLSFISTEKNSNENETSYAGNKFYFTMSHIPLYN